MKYNIHINQYAAHNFFLNTGLNIVDCSIFDYIASLCKSTNKKIKRIIFTDEVYTWVDYGHLISEMPILGITTERGIIKRVNKLLKYQILNKKIIGNKAYFTITNIGKKLLKGEHAFIPMANKERAKSEHTSIPEANARSYNNNINDNYINNNNNNTIEILPLSVNSAAREAVNVVNNFVEENIVAAQNLNNSDNLVIKNNTQATQNDINAVNKKSYLDNLNLILNSSINTKDAQNSTSTILNVTLQNTQDNLNKNQIKNIDCKNTLENLVIKNTQDNVSLSSSQSQNTKQNAEGKIKILHESLAKRIKILNETKATWDVAVKEKNNEAFYDLSKKYGALEAEIEVINNQINFFNRKTKEGENVEKLKDAMCYDPEFILKLPGKRTISSFEQSTVIRKLKHFGFEDASLIRLCNEVFYEARFGGLIKDKDGQEKSVNHVANIVLDKIKKEQWQTPYKLYDFLKTIDLHSYKMLRQSAA